jgi:hypothetical protein
MADHDPQMHPEAAQQARQEAEQEATRLERHDLQWLMGFEQGRRIVHRILERAGLDRTSFTGNSTTFFKEGERELGLWLKRKVISAAGIKAYTLMVEENTDAG